MLKPILIQKIHLSFSHLCQSTFQCGCCNLHKTIFCIHFAHENMTKNIPKSRIPINSKIAAIFSTAHHSGTCNYQGGYTEYMTQCEPYVIHVKRLLRVHTQCPKREYRWESVVWLQLSILHPKNTKLGKAGNFRCL